MKILDLFIRSPEKTAAHRLYEQIVLHARSPGFYLKLGVPDTVDGRFDMIVLHTFLVLHRLKSDPQQTAKLSQRLFDLLFADMDQNLREMGVGDLSVGKKIKKMTAAFQGRLVAYEKALESKSELKQALDRNLYRHQETNDEHLDFMADYVLRQAKALSRQTTAALMHGHVEFATQ
ncbi:MAG: ubiquinol-cytochrome C chaperone family protein [Rhodospirillales bacterium]